MADNKKEQERAELHRTICDDERGERNHDVALVSLESKLSESNGTKISALLDEKLIAPCGMNCGLCIAYQFKGNDINRLGFHKKYCPGCIPRGENCTHMRDACELLAKGSIRFCFECENFPCKRLKALDKRYHTKYHMSMIENLNYINEFGMEEFLKKENEKWLCTECGAAICCHNGLCLNCNVDMLLMNKKYRWGE